MNPIIFGKSVQGASHKRSGKECQDSCKQQTIGDTLFLAVADGHGSESCPYSKSGSEIAVNVFIKILSEHRDSYGDDLESLLTYLNREGETKVAQLIDQEWKRRVLKSHSDNRREIINDSNGAKDKTAIYKQYGSTLLGMMITPLFIFSFQLGDGDIVYADADSIEPVIAVDKILGVETHSLSKPESWKHAITVIKRRDENEHTPFAFILTTDGFANSFTNTEEYQKSCRGYFDMIVENDAGRVGANLGKWLAETSEFGCGDDVTMLIAYYPAEIAEESGA